MPGKMNEPQRLAEELRLLFEGPSWLGPSIDLLLSDLSRDDVNRKPLAGLHSIWELVLHIELWLRVARLRLTADSPLDPTDDESWPKPVGTWQETLVSLREERVNLQNAIAQFPVDRLEHAAPAAEPQTFYVLLHGVIEHSAYHAGQIAILKKAAQQP
jgi:uncharacterized damage-inducible protein DinB